MQFDNLVKDEKLFANYSYRLMTKTKISLESIDKMPYALFFNYIDIMKEDIKEEKRSIK